MRTQFPATTGACTDSKPLVETENNRRPVDNAAEYRLLG